MDDTPEREFIRAKLAEIYKPRCTERIEDYALRCLTLVSVEAEFAGLKYDVRRSPLLRDFFQWWQDPTSPHREYVTMKGSQGGYTLGAIVASCYDFAHDPRGTIYMANTDPMAAAVGKNRFVPMLRQVDEAVNDAIDDAGDGAVFKNIKGHMFICSGGMVPSKLISWPLSRAHLDEAANHKRTEKGTTWELVAKRLEKQSDTKLNIFSKPEKWPQYRADAATGKLDRISGDDSLFTEKWMSGTQHVPMVPCPHCGKRQELTDNQFRAPDHLLPGIEVNESDMDLEQIERETWYECVHCKLPIYDHLHKKAMVEDFVMMPAPLDPEVARREGFARPRMLAFDPLRPEIVRYRRPDPGVRSQHVSDLYNIYAEECRWGALHRKKLVAMRDAKAFETYCKDVRGEPPPEEEKAGEVTSKLLTRLCGPYYRMQVYNPLTNQVQAPLHRLPCEARLIIMTSDYQQGQVGQSSYWPWVLATLDEKFQLSVIDYGTVFSLDDVEEIFVTEFLTPSGRRISPQFGLMDAQYDPETVHEFCKRPRIYRRMFPSSGAGKAMDLEKRDLSIKTGFPFWFYSYRAEYWEGQLYKWQLARWLEFLDPERPGGIYSIPALRHAERYPRLYLPLDTGNDFYEQLSNMHETWRHKEDPQQGLTWLKIHASKPNDFGDDVKLLLIARKLFQNLQRNGHIPPPKAEKPDPEPVEEEDETTRELRAMGLA